MMRKGNKVAFPDRSKQRNQSYGNTKSTDSPPKARQSEQKDVNSMSRIELLRAGLAGQKVDQLDETMNEMKTDTRGSFKDAKKKVMF